MLILSKTDKSNIGRVLHVLDLYLPYFVVTLVFNGWYIEKKDTDYAASRRDSGIMKQYRICQRSVAQSAGNCCNYCPDSTIGYRGSWSLCVY